MKPILAFLICLLALLGCEADNLDQPSEALAATDYPEGFCYDLSGSWEMISMKVTTPDTSYAVDQLEQPTLKVLNETHWMFIRQSAEEFVFAQGGPYKIEDGAYTEIVGYSAEPGNIDQEYVFECRLEGDSLWHHRGDLGNMFVDEVWRRVESEESM